MENFEVLHTAHIDILMIHLHTKYYMPSYNDSINLSIKLDAKYRFYAIIMLFFIRKGNESL
jgi:hypothetical protein